MKIRVMARGAAVGVAGVLLGGTLVMVVSAQAAPGHPAPQPSVSATHPALGTEATAARHLKHHHHRAAHEPVYRPHHHVRALDSSSPVPTQPDSPTPTDAPSTQPPSSPTPVPTCTVVGNPGGSPAPDPCDTPPF